MKKIEIINQWYLSRIFDELNNGNMRIPRFQRDYVWERSKVVKLLNSIYMQYPIGTFFLWEADTSMSTFCRDMSDFGFPKEPDGKKFLFILDGQQRITSLYLALNGKTFNNIDYGTICFNLDKKIFKIPTLKTEPNNIPVWKIFDESACNDLILQIINQREITGEDDGGVPHDSSQFIKRKEYIESIMYCRQLLHNYPISIVKTSDMDLESVVDIFERINQGGKRLTAFDLVHASVWSEDFDLRTEIAKFNDEPAIRLFGSVNEEIFTQSLALNVKNDCTKLVQLKLTNADCKTNWEQTKECLRLAIDYMKMNLGVQNISIMPYQNMLSVVQYYFFKGRNNTMQNQHKQVLEDWFWTTTFSNRYSSSTLTRMNEDAYKIASMLDGEDVSIRYTVKLNISDLKRSRMNTRSVIKDGILCLMALNAPKDFDNGNLVTLNNTNASRSISKENHHFFPYSLYSKFGVQIDEINSVLNFAFITKRLNLDILDDKPSVYLAKYESTNPDILEHLNSHFISKDAFEAAKNDDFNAFVEARGKELLQRINTLCHVDEQTESTDIFEKDDEYDE